MDRREAIEILSQMKSRARSSDLFAYIGPAIDFAIADMKVCDKMNQGWVRVNDHPPDVDGEYVVCNADGVRFFCTYDSFIEDPDQRFGVWVDKFDDAAGGWIGEEWIPFDNIKCWFCVPEPPSEGESKCK